FGALALLGLIGHVQAEDGVTDTTIRIGQTVGVTGTVAGPVKEMNEGAAAYFNMINKNGGVHGRKIELITLDDKFDPAITKVNAETLIKKEKVFAMFQGRGTPHNQGILPLLTEYKVPHLAPATGATVFHEPLHKWMFNVRANYHVEIEEIIKNISFTGHKKISLLHVDDAFGRDGLEGFNKAMAKAKLTPVSITTFARVKPDYAAAAKDVIQANPSALLILSSSKNTVEVIKEIRAQGGKMQLMTLSNNSSDSFVNDLREDGRGVMVSQVTPSPYSRSTSLGREFNVAAKESNATISYAAMEGYINAKVLVEALKRAGPNPTRTGFAKALESIRNEDLGGLSVTYGPNDHAGSIFVELTMIGKDGKFIR
ncbi:MAG: ABC transporter substrate-binding protein, partial [Burkholderiaceae bacterium]